MRRSVRFGRFINRHSDECTIRFVERFLQYVPSQGALYVCGKCRNPFDIFATQGLCPNCNTQYTATSCPECGSLRPITEWESYGQAPPKL